jgi:hydroxymethylpyrimidine/phosphomethylpyrimidine kinase
VPTTPIALTIAGSDPGGGAGLQADLKTFHQFGVYGTSVVTLITVQNTVRTSRVEILDARLVEEQLEAILEDIPPQAIKTGALGSAEIIEMLAAHNFKAPLIVDPVAIGKHGAELTDLTTLRNKLLPKAFLITPNLDEAEALTGREVRDLAQMQEAAKRIADLGARSVLIKGGHLEGDAVDLLLNEGIFTEFRSPRIATNHTHGTGCVCSAAITAGMAGGSSLIEAVTNAKAFIEEAIRTAPGIGKGTGPLNLLATGERPTARNLDAHRNERDLEFRGSK